ncbi:hypothetical protein LAZ29_13975 [Cereibacter sphaeroides]|uniref:hypothetical protein n=1 Tax=Cereibacter sphaeroides TaxID=1063 RepID=UPI001F1A10BE|nr:hypothetical protein [Cereibacter sphaeroides]MCE6952038.1 hypothetical protein [Cereibacter sphaeroides]
MRDDRRTLLIDGYQPSRPRTDKGWFAREPEKAANGHVPAPPKAVSAIVIPGRGGVATAAPKK